jgi:hypothetical protein
VDRELAAKLSFPGNPCRMLAYASEVAALIISTVLVRARKACKVLTSSKVFAE